ncbi:MAG: hypothetical protein AAFW47_06690 [Pseudomonadota bacterium]
MKKRIYILSLIFSLSADFAFSEEEKEDELQLSAIQKCTFLLDSAQRQSCCNAITEIKQQIECLVQIKTIYKLDPKGFPPATARVPRDDLDSFPAVETFKPLPPSGLHGGRV